jgi:tetratricopeptide (TPR) repeat protein
MSNNRLPISVRLQRAYANVLRRLSRAGSALVSPFESAVMAVLNAAFRLVERGQGVESLFGRIGYLLLWPFRLAARFFGALSRVLVPRSVRNGLAQCVSWFASVGFRAGRAVLRSAEWLNLDGILFGFVKLAKPIWYPFAAVAGFLIAWTATRPLKKLLWGLPALLLVMPILAATAWGAYWGKEAIATRYKLALTETLEKKDYSKTQLLERKLSEFGIDTALSDFNTAKALERDGELAKAYDRMQRLAPVEAPGYPMAHIWLIQHLLSGKLDLPEVEVHRLAGIHLQHVASLGIRGPEIDMMRAAWLTQDNKLAEAAALLKPLVHRYPSAAVERFRIDLALNQPEQARLDAREVCDQLRRERQNGTSLSDHEYESWVAAAQMLASRDESREIGQAWLEHFPESAGARKNIAALSLQEFDRMFTGTDANPQELAARLRTGFELANVTENMQDRIVLLYQQQAARPELRALFAELAKSPDLPPGLAEALGTAAALSGDLSQARKYLRMAIAADPGNAVSWNNLAYVLLQTPDPPLDEALDATNKALTLVPNDYRFRQTRGEVLVKLHRWQEAVDDLEFALNGAPDAPTIHQSLAQAYEALGNKELAAAHRQNAN